MIFEAAETLGGRCRAVLCAPCAGKPVCTISRWKKGLTSLSSFIPGRWTRATIQAEHDFLKALEQSEIPVVAPLTDDKGQSIHEINQVMFAIFPKRPGRLEPELRRNS